MPTPMIYHLYGPDSLRKARKMAELMIEIKKSVYSSEELDVDLGESTDSWKDVVDFMNQQSIFGGSKVAVVKEASAVDEKPWLKFLKESASDGSIFIFLLNKEKPKKAFDFLLKKPSLVYEFGELSGKELASFVSREAEKRGFSFSAEALNFLVAFLMNQKEGRSWLAESEIEKAGFLGKKIVQVADLNGISYFPEFDQVWSLTRKILDASRWTDKVYFLEKLMTEGADPSYVFNSLAFGSRGRESVRLSDYDILIKSGKLDFPEALLSFVLGGV